MTEHHTDDHPAELEAEEARAGETSGHMRWVLGISLTVAVLALAFVAITQFA